MNKKEKNMNEKELLIMKILRGKNVLNAAENANRNHHRRWTRKKPRSKTRNLLDYHSEWKGLKPMVCKKSTLFISQFWRYNSGTDCCPPRPHGETKCENVNIFLFFFSVSQVRRNNFQYFNLNLLPIPDNKGERRFCVIFFWVWFFFSHIFLWRAVDGIVYTFFFSTAPFCFEEHIVGGKNGERSREQHKTIGETEKSETQISRVIFTRKRCMRWAFGGKWGNLENFKISVNSFPTEKERKKNI